MEFELNIVFVEQKLTTHLFGVLCRFECNMFPVVSLKRKVILPNTRDNYLLNRVVLNVLADKLC